MNSKIPNLTILTLDEPNITDFAAARNKLLATVKTPWVLFLDQDETISPTLAKEIAAWEAHRNKHNAKADWQFTTKDARVKLKRLYPQF